MQKFWFVLFMGLVVILGAGAFMLTRWDIPAQAKQVEKVLPDDMFPK